MIPKGNSSLLKVKYTREERERIVEALKILCVAKASFWDALRAVECRIEDVEIDTDYNLEGTMAAEHNVPPSYSDVPDPILWRAFLSNAKVKFYPKKEG